MTDKNTTNGYLQISTNAYGLLVDAIASSNQRSLDYTKSVWKIASRPYASKGLPEVVRENIDRSNEFVSLTVSALQTRRQKMAELAEKLAGQIVERQDSSVQLLRNAVETGVSNMQYAKDATRQGLDDINKRIEETQSRPTAAASLN